MKEKIISKDDLLSLVKSLINDKYRVISYVKDEEAYRQINDASEFAISGSFAPAKTSIKKVVFPPTEPLLFYKKIKDDINISEPLKDEEQTVLFGVKPCDAKSIDTLSKVFNWDYKDEFFNEKADKVITIGVKCLYSDEFCFCDSVNLSPDSRKGSDIFITPKDDTSFVMEIVTEKGEKFISKYQSGFAPSASSGTGPSTSSGADPSTGSGTGPSTGSGTVKIDVEKIREWLNNNFDNPVWATFGLTCLGCGKCAFICPTCHCFDIVDEEYSSTEGRRMKNWDACQFGKFTLHASGHNPRNTQPMRYRQRINHKFKYYFDKFEEILCTGCGRCSRECPVGISISDILKELESLAKK
jgi:ferredoxin